MAAIPYSADALPARLTLRGISKTYGSNRANDGIDLTVGAGEIHALLGENGAGKSTLVKIIYGVTQPDSGAITWDGQPVQITTPHAARALGIGMVFQHFSLFESLTIAENIALGLDHPPPMAELATRIVEMSARYGLAVTPDRHVHHLSVGERQRVEILRCLLQSPRLLILDEPTAVLTPQEADNLAAMLRLLAAEGCSILYISHKLEEVTALCEAATVLRAGRGVGTADPRRVSGQALAEMMVGSTLPEVARPTAAELGPVCLELAGLSLEPDSPFGTALRDISFRLRQGEILGIAGVAGNGQTELLAALSGERIVAQPEIVHIAGKPAGNLGPTARRRFGLAFIPEERIGRGAVGPMTLAENLLLSGESPVVIHHGRLLKRALAVIKRFGVRASGAGAAASSLSGGNLQKYIVGREIADRPRVLLAAHPTWGVDIGAALAIRKAILALAAEGTGVLIVSEDLSELFEITHRIAVLSGGRLFPPMATANASIETVGQQMGGLHGAEKLEADLVPA
jgi:general nucleoside transport system ATP-binding protein